MIQRIITLPENVVGFKAEGEVTADDVEKVKKEVEAFMKDRKDLNYMLIINTPLSNFTAGAWFRDALLGLKNITHWNRCAIICESDVVKAFTVGFSKIMPGEFRVYKHAEKDAAVKWLTEGDNHER